MITLKTPLKEKDILSLNTGDKVLISGTLFTARDKAHKFLLEENFGRINNSIIYHCGPIIKNNNVIAAGPTTSARLNQFTPELIKKYQIKAIIGKGGMDREVLNSLKGNAVYLSATGGAAVLYAKTMRIKGVFKPEFGMPESIYELEIKDFPAIVTMDAKGNSLYEEVYRESKKVFEKLIENSV